MTAAAMCVCSHAEVKVTVTPLGEKPEGTMQKKVSNANILVNEDFSAWENGSIDEPEWGEPFATYDNPNIDPEFTHGEQWQGRKCYAAGGACALRTFDPMGSAYIATPKMDYSGSLVITFLAKYQLVEWEDEDGSKWHWSGSSIGVQFNNDGGNVFETNENENIRHLGLYANVIASNIRLYENDGWCEVKIELDNYSAYNDASLVFFSNDGILIDDIKVTSSIDNFIASPIIDGITDVTETSFTVNFQSVKRAFNYYMYLYEVKGYDENGEPILQLTFPPEVIESLEAYGMTLEEYIEDMGGEESPYVYYGQVDRRDPTTFTYTGLNPAKDYYYAICSHNVYTFSERKLHPANVIAVPEVTAATDITANGFTANWNPIVKAENYDVTLYGVNQVQEDTDDFIIFEEDFENVSAYTSATDINNPDTVDPESGITLDDLTSTPGWEMDNLEHLLLVEGKLGLDDWNYLLVGPSVYVGGADEVNISLCIESPLEEFDLYFKFAGVRYMIPVTDGRFEDTFTLPTNGLKETDFWIAADEAAMFVDYIVMSQPLHKGDYTYTYLGTQTTENAANSMQFSGLDKDFDFYAYGVKAFRGDIVSEQSDRMIVDLKNGGSHTGVDEIATEVVEVARYSLDGRRLERPESGMNIVRYSDGSVKKVMVK